MGALLQGRVDLRRLDPGVDGEADLVGDVTITQLGERNGCTQRALSVSRVENMVVALYKHLQLESEVRHSIEQHLKTELERGSLEARRAQRDLALEQARLDARSRKLLDAHLDGVIPPELYKEEQRSISQQLATVVERLEALSVGFDELERNLTGAIELASNCYEAYRRAPDALRRTYNQAFFKRILICEEEPADGELQELFEVVFRPASPAPTEVEEREEAENTVLSASEGSKEVRLVPLEGFEL